MCINEEIVQDCRILQCDAMKFGRWVWTFLGNLLALSSWWILSWRWRQFVCKKYWYMSVTQFTFCDSVILIFTAVKNFIFCERENYCMSWISVQAGIAQSVWWLWAGQSRIQFLPSLRLALELTQCPVQWVMGGVFPPYNVEFKSRVTPLSLCVSSWHA